MSAFNEIDVECEQCEEEFRAEVWTAVHAGEDPELKDLLLGGELNLVSCPRCGHVTFQERFLLYQEPSAELIAYVHPTAEESRAESLRQAMVSGFRGALADFPERQKITYEPVLLFGLESLVELLQAEGARAEQSQIAQAICREKKVETYLLRPSQARRLQIMRVLPRTGRGDPPTRAQILEGLEKLLTLNPALDLYRQLRQTIQSEIGWRLLP